MRRYFFFLITAAYACVTNDDCPGDRQCNGSGHCSASGAVLSATGETCASSSDCEFGLNCVDQGCATGRRGHVSTTIDDEDVAPRTKSRAAVSVATSAAVSATKSDGRIVPAPIPTNADGSPVDSSSDFKSKLNGTVKPAITTSDSHALFNPFHPMPWIIVTLMF